MFLNKQKKKAQEEMVGLVVIMLIVAIIFLIFLGLYLRNSQNVQTAQSKDIEIFIESMFQLSTECGPDNSPIKLSELIVKCSQFSETDCKLGDKKGCEEIEEIFNDAITRTWNFNENSPTKNYFLQIYRRTDKGDVSVIPPFTGPFQTTNTIRESEKILPNGITIKLQIYY